MQNSIFTFTEIKQMIIFTQKLGFSSLGAYLIDRISETQETCFEVLLELNHSSTDLFIDQIS